MKAIGEVIWVEAGCHPHKNKYNNFEKKNNQERAGK